MTNLYYIEFEHVEDGRVVTNFEQLYSASDLAKKYNTTPHNMRIRLLRGKHKDIRDYVGVKIGRKNFYYKINKTC